MKRLLPLAALALAVASCNTSGCLDNRNAIPRAQLYSSATGDAVTVNMLQIYGIGAPNDSVLVESGDAVSEIYLPMRSEHQTTSWCFHYTQSNISDLAMNDTITFGYTSTPYFASEECGASYRYNITSCTNTTHIVDSVVVVDSLITNVDRVRIRIYLRTAEPEPEPEPQPES